MILAIDPGLRWCGCALGDESGLKRAALVINPEKKIRGPIAWREMALEVARWGDLDCIEARRTFIETPRIYPHSDQRKGDLNDLLELAGVVGAISSFTRDKLNFYYPSEWKGNVPKKIMTERIRKRLRPDELAVFESVGAKDHNTLDAVGIFLHSVKRL